MRTSLIITALMAVFAFSAASCDDQTGGASKAVKTAKPGADKPGGNKADPTVVKVHEEYLPEAQRQVNADNLDETVSQLEDDILTEQNP